jgi:hypothetical protein
MTERAAVVGGELRAGPTPDGGFAVRARLPTELPIDGARIVPLREPAHD